MMNRLNKIQNKIIYLNYKICINVAYCSDWNVIDIMIEIVFEIFL